MPDSAPRQQRRRSPPNSLSLTTARPRLPCALGARRYNLDASLYGSKQELKVGWAAPAPRDAHFIQLVAAGSSTSLSSALEVGLRRGARPLRRLLRRRAWHTDSGYDHPPARPRLAAAPSQALIAAAKRHHIAAVADIVINHRWAVFCLRNPCENGSAWRGAACGWEGVATQPARIRLEPEASPPLPAGRQVRRRAEQRRVEPVQGRRGPQGESWMSHG